MTKLNLDGKEYNFSALNKECQQLVVDLDMVNKRIQEIENLQAILNKAKRAYIVDLKTEMLAAKAGFDFTDWWNVENAKNHYRLNSVCFRGFNLFWQGTAYLVTVFRILNNYGKV